MAHRGHTAATFIHNFVALPSHIFISCQQTTLTVSNFADFKALSGGFDETSQTGPFQKLVKPRKCLLITLSYAKNISLNLSFPTFLQGTL